jgi:hypothetical protein
MITSHHRDLAVADYQNCPSSDYMAKPIAACLLWVDPVEKGLAIIEVP